MALVGGCAVRGGGGVVFGGVVGRGGAVGIGNVRMWGLQALPDTGAPKLVGRSLRGRSARAAPVAPVEPRAASPDDGRASRDGGAP
ncbi:hypothetical protein ABZ770_15595 [Streptomyces sp. NPDC006654]|uniref:hypothetical protein n=1 Tax=unclassified Streptomyces TaxID=2593676 RepID=UPI00340A3867